VRVPLPVTFLAVIALAACGGGSPTVAPTSVATGTPAGATGTPAGATATLAGASATAAAIVCAASGSGTAATIADFAFAPNPVTVSSGGFATWTNNDSTTHTVTFDSGPDCGNVAGGGGSVTVAFNVAGTYPYHCSIHTSMKGSVTVGG
jgi:plastocyanin